MKTPSEVPWGITEEGFVEYYDPFDDHARKDGLAIQFGTRFSTESKAQVAKALMEKSHQLISHVVENEEHEEIAKLYLDLEELLIDRT